MRAGILIAAVLPNHLMASFLVLVVLWEASAVQGHLANKAKWYKAKAVECATLAKSARRNFIREIYRKAAVRSDFAEEVLRRRIEEALTSVLPT
jgi:hypothetical protein